MGLPPGWDGRIAVRGFPLPGAAVVYAASFPLPARDDAAASKAQQAVRRDDVLVIVSETLHETGLPSGKPEIALSALGASIGRYAVVDQYFIVRGRAFVSTPPSARSRPLRD